MVDANGRYAVRPSAMLGGVNLDVRSLSGTTEAEAATILLADVFGATYDSAPIPGDLMASISAWGGCVLGAFADGELVGVVVGIAAAPHSDTLASLVAGVRPGAAGTGVGQALKQAQQRWAAQRGVAGIEWHYDPLVRRNAHFNLVRLGADVVGYHVERYPPIPDGINANDLTDRFLVRLDVAQGGPREPVVPGEDAVVVLEEGEDGAPRAHDRPRDRPWLVGTPADIETMRRKHPERSRAWRLALREVFLDGERRVAGLTRDGFYLLPAQTEHDAAATRDLDADLDAGVGGPATTDDDRRTT